MVLPSPAAHIFAVKSSYECLRSVFSLENVHLYNHTPYYLVYQIQLFSCDFTLASVFKTPAVFFSVRLSADEHANRPAAIKLFRSSLCIDFRFIWVSDCR